MGDEDLVLSAHAQVCEGRDAVEGLEWGRGAAVGKKKSSGAFCIKQQSGNSSAPKVPF